RKRKSRTEGQCRDDHQAGIGLGEDRSADGASQRRCADESESAGGVRHRRVLRSPGSWLMKARATKPGRIRSALLAWIGKPFGLTDTDAWAALSSATVGGVQVNAQTMLTISAVWACARLISETIATLPLSMYERTS